MSRFLTTLVLSAALIGCASPTDLEFENARVRALIPGQDKTVAYVDVHNHTEAPMVLVGAESTNVRAIEIHTTSLQDGVMRMRRLTDVTIPAGETIHFQPGARHMMLFGVKSLGPELDIQLRFADGSSRTTTFRQIAIGAK